MTGDKTDEERMEYRKRRIMKIKKAIITLCIILLVLPTILSIFLTAKLCSLQRQIDVISAGKQSEQSRSDVVQASTKTASPPGGDTVSVSAVAGSPSDTVSKAAVASGGGKSAKKVYLTFDDGPGTQTAKILDILKKQDVKATFFVTGKEDAYSQEMYRRIVEEGHTLGMHSYSHIYDTIYKSEKTFAEDFNKLYDMLFRVTGVRPEWYRFPGGSSTGTMRVSLNSLVGVLGKKKVSYVDWNVITPEAMNPGVSKKEMIDGIMSSMAEYDTAVVMLYDAANRPMTVKALPSLIKEIKQNKYELLPVSQDMVPVRHSQIN